MSSTARVGKLSGLSGEDSPRVRALDDLFMEMARCEKLGIYTHVFTLMPENKRAVINEP